MSGRNAWAGRSVECPHCKHVFTLTATGTKETLVARSPYGPRHAEAACPNCGRVVPLVWKAEKTDRTLTGAVTIRKGTRTNEQP